MNKQERHQLIKQLIGSQKIQTQEDLLKEIEDLGVTTTQATISRDIRELGIVKARENQETYYSLLETTEMKQSFDLALAYQAFVKSVAQAEFVLVIKTAIGDANALASRLDETKEIDGLIGTIAGADTIVLIMQSVASAEALKQTIEDEL
ncbi:MAG: arginine repressor [Streptococcaceae bacterium]|nr:arginine repressor [Streptococcaceae bacterium]